MAGGVMDARHNIILIDLSTQTNASLQTICYISYSKPVCIEIFLFEYVLGFLSLYFEAER